MRTCLVSGEAVCAVASDFNGRNWIKQGTWPGSFLWFAAVLEGFSEEWTGRVLGPGMAIRDYACIGEDHGAFDCLIGADCFTEIAATISSGYDKSGPAYFQEYARLCERACEDWLGFPSRLPTLQELDEADGTVLAGLWRDYFAHFRECSAFMDSIIVLADVLGDKVGTLISDALRAEGIEDPRAYGAFLEIHGRAPIPTNVTLAEASLAKIAAQVSNSPSLLRLFRDLPADEVCRATELQGTPILRSIEAHRDSFGWLNTYSFTGKPYTIADIVALVQEKLEGAAAPTSTAEQGGNLAESSLNSRLTSMSVPDELRELLAVTGKLSYVNALKDDVHQITWQQIGPLVKETARRLGSSEDDVVLYTPGEIDAALCSPESAESHSLARAEGWALLKLGDTTFAIQGTADLSELRGRLRRYLPIDAESLIGRGVFPGIVQGAARLVLTSKDCERVQPGDVLVATNTSPDFIPAMHRAAAFVTDTGNLICHAVIAAREFRKPCVISTQIATQVLQDGELIEVNGLEGTVRRLSAAKPVSTPTEA
jgi:phosphohistidine swiveling domain-containing protein